MLARCRCQTDQTSQRTEEEDVNAAFSNDHRRRTATIATHVPRDIHRWRHLKPWKIGTKNGLFAGSALAGQRASVVMSLVQSAKLNGLDPWAYLSDVLARIHSHPSHRLDELLPHLWRPD